MTTTSTDIHAPEARRGTFARVLAAFLQRLENRGQFAARRRQMAALDAKSAAALAAMGLRRDQIVHHVFRALYYM